MDPHASDEQRMIIELVEKFVDNELMPLEAAVLQREIRGEKLALTDAEEAPLVKKCKELGLWGLDAPPELGGMSLPTAAFLGVHDELGRTVTPFVFPPDSPNMHMLLATADENQRRKYLEPYAKGEATSAIAVSEPGAGGDPAGMTTRAEKIGDQWVLNGRKIWISRVAAADFTIVMARIAGTKGHEGVTAFIVEKAPRVSKCSARFPCSRVIAPTKSCSKTAASPRASSSERSAKVSHRCSSG